MLAVLKKQNGIAGWACINIGRGFKGGSAGWPSKLSRPSVFAARKYRPAPVRKEFEKPITLQALSRINYESGKHFVPQKVSDTVALYLVKFFRAFADVYFQNRYVDRSALIETIAAIPGVVGGLFRHLYSLRNLEDNGESIHKLLREAENERQHLMTFMAIKKCTVLDKMLIRLGQVFFFNFYFAFYLLFPRTAHRFVGYLEEEAIRSYDCFEQEIIKGRIENVLAPMVAVEYWKLPGNSRLLDVVRAIRADEAAHRDTNHDMANNENFSLVN